DGLSFPPVHFFQPRYIVIAHNDLLSIEYLPLYDNEQSIYKTYEAIIASDLGAKQSQQFYDVQSRISKEDYLATVNKINQHIKQGDIYELNYCMEFYTENAVEINAVNLYHRLNDASPMPFSCFYKNRHHYAACASPERFIAKRGNKIISQPMKGTAARGH